jgi:hypothetical protein
MELEKIKVIRLSKKNRSPSIIACRAARKPEKRTPDTSVAKKEGQRQNCFASA